MTTVYADMEHLINNHQAPSVATFQRTEKELPLNRIEITTAINPMQNGKAPGSNGYPMSSI